MPARFERFMALRYLREAQGRAEGRGFIRFILYAAIGGVALGVAALLLALSIVRGFSSEIEAKIVGFGAHVQVESLLEAPLEDASVLARRLGRLPGVQHVAPVVEDFALLRTAGASTDDVSAEASASQRGAPQIDGVGLWGTDAPPAYLKDHLHSGAFSFAPDAAGRPGVVVGKQLAERLGIQAGDVVTIFAMPPGLEAEGDGLFPQPRVKQFHVSGVYETSLGDFDDLYVFADLAAARALLGVGPEAVTRFDLTLGDPNQAGRVAGLVNSTFDFPVQALTIYQVFSGLFAWVNLQQSITPVVIGVIILVAAFNIIGTLLMLMLEKTREIGVLSTLGASGRAVRRLFLGLGVLIGLVGTGLGEALALALALLQKRYALIPLPAEAYYMTTAPVELNALDFVLVGVLALMLCAAAAYVPARIASRIQPVRAIRFQ